MKIIQIHTVCILKKSGVMLYTKNISEILQDVNFALLSSFIGALMQFSNAVLGSGINDVDLGKMRFFFRNINGFIFLIVADNTVSSLLVNDRIEKIAEILFQEFSPDVLHSLDIIIDNMEIDMKIEKIATFQDKETYGDQDFIKGIFEQEVFQGEMRAGALLSLKGDIYYSSLPIDILNLSLKELEIKTQADSTHLNFSPKNISQTREYMVFSQVVSLPNFQTPVLIVLMFSSKTGLGMGDFTLEDMLVKLKKK